MAKLVRRVTEKRINQKVKKGIAVAVMVLSVAALLLTATVENRQAGTTNIVKPGHQR